MKINHTGLINSLRLAYSAEKAAAYAYIGHARSLKNPAEKAAVQQIENDEWEHRENVLSIMKEYVIPVSKYYEFKYAVITADFGMDFKLLRLIPQKIIIFHGCDIKFDEKCTTFQ